MCTQTTEGPRIGFGLEYGRPSMPSESRQQRLLNAIVDAATAAGREAMASIGLDEWALSHAMLIAGNVLCLMAQSRLEAAGVGEAAMDSTIEGAVEMGVAYTLQIEHELHSLKH